MNIQLRQYVSATATSFSIDVFHDALGTARLVLTKPTLTTAVRDSVTLGLNINGLNLPDNISTYMDNIAEDVEIGLQSNSRIIKLNSIQSALQSSTDLIDDIRNNM